MTKEDYNTGSRKNIIKKEIFNREILLCQEMYRKDKGCCWGRCEKCGVIPLLHKLHKGELIDNKDEIKKLKNETLNN